jgi:hypothetical protein
MTRARRHLLHAQLHQLLHDINASRGSRPTPLQSRPHPFVSVLFFSNPSLDHQTVAQQFYECPPHQGAHQPQPKLYENLCLLAASKSYHPPVC